MNKPRTKNANKARSLKADEFALSLIPVLEHCHNRGRIKSREIIASLEMQGIKPVRGGKWTRSQLIRVKKRLFKINKEQPGLIDAVRDKVLAKDLSD